MSPPKSIQIINSILSIYSRAYTVHIHRSSSFRLDLNDRLHLDQGVQGQGVGTDGRPGVVAHGLVKDFHNHVGAAVHDLVMELEVGRRVDNSKDLGCALCVCANDLNVDHC